MHVCRQLLSTFDSDHLSDKHWRVVAANKPCGAHMLLNLAAQLEPLPHRASSVSLVVAMRLLLSASCKSCAFAH